MPDVVGDTQGGKKKKFILVQIYLQYLLCLGQGHGGSEACPGNTRHQVGIDPGRDASPSQRTTCLYTFADSFTLQDNLQSQSTYCRGVGMCE